jgi:hypothetical protein
MVVWPPACSLQALRFVMTSRPDDPVIMALGHVFKPFVIAQDHPGHTQDLRALVTKELTGRLVVTHVGASTAQPAIGDALRTGVEVVVANSSGAFVYVARCVQDRHPSCAQWLVADPCDRV